MSDDGRGPLVALGATALLGLVLLATGAREVGVALTLLALAGLLAAAIGPVREKSRERVDDVVVPRWAGADAQALAAEQRRLLAALDDPEQFRTSVRPRVAALVTDRLARRGLDRDDPRARELLGAPFAAFLDGTAGRAPSPAAFAAMLDRLEDL